MKTLIENFKSLAAPKRFIGLTFRKGMVGYAMLVMLIFSVLTYALYYFIGNPDSTLLETLETKIPDFQYADGELRFNSDEEYINTGATYLYVNTSARSFSLSPDDYNYIYNYVDLDEVYAIQALLLSRTNCIVINSEDVRIGTLEEAFGTETYSKTALINLISEILPWFYLVFYFLLSVGAVIGVFFYALLWGLTAFLINRSQKIKYTYGRMYRLAVYVMIPLRILRMLFVHFVPLPGILFIMLFWGLTFVYLILALFMDENQKNTAFGNPYMPGTPNTPDPYEPTSRF